MAIEAGDFKTGLTVMVDGDPWQVIDFMHVKPGKGAAFVRTKLKNIKILYLMNLLIVMQRLAGNFKVLVQEKYWDLKRSSHMIKMNIDDICIH